MGNVTVGCRLPNGIIIDLYNADGSLAKSVELKGANSDINGPIIILNPRMCGYTQVDEDFMNKWLDQNKDFAPLVSGAIFVEKTIAKAQDSAAALADEKTGFEAESQAAAATV